MPLRRARSSRAPSRARTVVVSVLAVSLMLGGSVATLVDSVPHLAYAARWQGTPGLMTVAACRNVGFSRERHVECVGIFRPDDGGPVDADATVDQSLSPGAVLPMQRTHAGGYVTVGFAPFAGWLAVALFGVLLAGVVVLVALSILLKESVRRAGLALGVLLGAALVCALTSAIASAIA